ncbi:putative coiled-coil domain-containing protein 106-like [Triplophysa rosa]|uniref:Coiled-coil domain-containing protein 106-like n=1 Tax=Triplophysa rosa TaxID=992332 RepID=A0A9W7WVZ5_TRIRA|nr:putative coiled-coil domain-containing protein 106-like [Triplophysa rosa]
MLRGRKAKRPRGLPVLGKEEKCAWLRYTFYYMTIIYTDEENEVAEQSVDRESNPDTATPASCSLDRPSESEKAVEESPVDNLLKRIEALEQERDFLSHTLASVCGKEKKKKKKDTSSESDELNSSSSSSLPSSSSEDERCHKKKSKKRTQKTGQDLLSPVREIQKVLHAYKKEGSMTRAFKKVEVDRNTLALTAVVAEIQITNPEFYRSIPQFQPQQEKLLDFAQRCSEALTTEMKGCIASCRLKYKFR